MTKNSKYLHLEFSLSPIYLNFAGVFGNMPFTIFHLGPALALGLLLRRRINLAALALASVLIDLHAAYCLFTGCRPLHGFLHTVTGALAVSLIVIILIYTFRGWLKEFNNFLEVEQSYSISSIVFGSVTGALLHIFIDLFTHIRMPLYLTDSTWSLYSPEALIATYGICTLMLILVAWMYFYRIR